MNTSMIRYGLLTVWLFTGYYGAAQQNLFNMPSGDVTPKGKVFFQEQLNYYPHQYIDAKSHFMYGISRRFEIGLNLVNLPLHFEAPVIRSSYQYSPLSPAMMATGMGKVVTFRKGYIYAGGQAGVNLSPGMRHTQFLFSVYSAASYHLRPGARLMAGYYYGNEPYLGPESTHGLLLGYEIKVLPKLYLMGDLIGGANHSSASVVGFMIPVTQRLQLCAGWQLPYPNPDLKHSLVLEINLLGYDWETEND